MDKAELFRMAQLIVMRTNSQEIKSWLKKGNEDDAQIKLDIIHCLHEAEQNELLLAGLNKGDAK